MSFQAIEDRHPPVTKTSVLGWIRNNLLFPWYNFVLTLVSSWIIWPIGRPFIQWAVIDAYFGTESQMCSTTSGACWAFIRDMWPVFMVGVYPEELRWRPLVALIIVLTLVALTCFRQLRTTKWLKGLWLLSPIAIFLAVGGSETLGIPVVSTDFWGGLMLTLILSAVAMIFAFPLSVLLALGRTSALPVIRATCVAWIDLVRGVPLITILFMASVVLPLFLPAGTELDKVLRAMVGITIFFSAYLAENTSDYSAPGFAHCYSTHGE